MTPPYADRFRKCVPEGEPDQCWEWQGSRTWAGYGRFWLNGKSAAAHRVAYELSNGPIPPGLLVRHSCDNKPCVNPAHLLVGTPKDNARDAVERGQYCRGAQNGQAKLTPEQVDEIRRRATTGEETQLSLARHFGVSRSAIQQLIQGKTWVGIGDLA